MGCGQKLNAYSEYIGITLAVIIVLPLPVFTENLINNLSQTHNAKFNLFHR